MNSVVRATLAVALPLTHSVAAHADEEALTLADALARARARGPAIVAARSRIEEARARLKGASLQRDNPLLEGALGRRHVDGAPTDLELGLSQTFELGGRRRARVAGAEAIVAREIAASDDAIRRVTREVISVFFGAVHAQERLRLARVAEAYGAEILHIAQRRHESGDVAILDVNVALSALARARAEARAAQASQVTALGDLRLLLDVRAEEPLVVAGSLGERRQYELPGLMARALERPDLRALVAELAEAEAEVRLGQSLAWPDVSPAVRYERDEGQTVLWGGVSMTLPLFNRGQDQRALGRARAQRIKGEIEALGRAVENEVRTALEAYELRVMAAEELQSTVAAVNDNEALARRSYEVGQIGLGEFLLLRRETVEARTALLERLLEAAQAQAELEARAGILR